MQKGRNNDFITNDISKQALKKTEILKIKTKENLI